MGINIDKLSGVWTATPTPLTEDMRIDTASIERMVDHHIKLGVTGLFLAGTNGEGPWLPDEDRRLLVRKVVERVDGRLLIAVQVTDNSARRILDNIDTVMKEGAEIAVVAQPYFQMNVTPDSILAFYREVIHNSPLPIGFYDRGKLSSVYVPNDVLKVICTERNVILVKDSSNDAERRDIFLKAKEKRPDLRLLTGYEFDCVSYLKAGYDGLLLGGGMFNGYLAGKIFDAVKRNDLEAAEELQARMNRIMYAVYGGKKIQCWLAGEKKLLVEMGIFNTWQNYPGFKLTESCIHAIRRVIKEDADVLMPVG